MSARIYSSIHPFLPFLPDIQGDVRRAGLDGVEMPCRLLDPTLAGELSLPPERLRGLRTSLHSDFADFNLASANPCVRRACVQQLRAEMALAAQWGFAPLTFHPGTSKKSERDEALRLLWKSLEELRSSASSWPARLCLENMDDKPDKLCGSEEEISHTLERFPGLGLTVDMAHLGLRGADIAAFMSAFDSRIAHIHVSGVRPGESHGRVSLKRSRVDFAPFLEALKDRDVAFVIENATWDLMMESRDVLEKALR